DRVHFAGFQSDITSFLAASDVFLLTSKSEGMPAVIIEAGVVGLPSVAYDVGGVKEIIEPETGIIVPPNNYNEFKAAVISLLKNPEKRKIMGAKANIQYSKHFNLDNTVKKYETLLFKLLSEKVNRENASS
ncbi:MAG: glycosyltransferase, partial [Promethearchaeota archaeon]